MKIRFKQAYGKFQPGWVIGTDDAGGQALIDIGVAEQVPEHTRLLKYAVDQALSFECVSPNAKPDAVYSKDAAQVEPDPAQQIPPEIPESQNNDFTKFKSRKHI